MIASRIVRAASACALLLATAVTGGCVIPGIVSVMGQQIEKDKDIEVLARYRGLENRSVAVLAHTMMSTAYEYPTAIPNIVGNVANEIQQNVGGARVLDPRHCVAWMHQNPGWPTMPMADLTGELDVDRVVVIDIYEYRLNPEGNAFLWEGVAAANIGVVERDGIDPDSYAEELQVISKFPDMEGVGREQAGAREIELGVQKTFVDEISYLFYDHIEKKYPNRGIRKVK
ncbi:MAG: hypothetical protein EXS03_07255 [Phycisphaerales bacterium]|nr:hypothetical protein [Phycisphaerales bacterium]